MHECFKGFRRCNDSYITCLVTLFQPQIPSSDDIFINIHHAFRVRSRAIVTVKSSCLKEAFLEMDDVCMSVMEKTFRWFMDDKWAKRPVENHDRVWVLFADLKEGCPESLSGTLMTFHSVVWRHETISKKVTSSQFHKTSLNF